MNLKNLTIAFKLLLISATYLVTTYFLTDFVYDFISTSPRAHFMALCGIYFLITAIAVTMVIKTLTGEEE